MHFFSSALFCTELTLMGPALFIISLCLEPKTIKQRRNPHCICLSANSFIIPSFLLAYFLFKFLLPSFPPTCFTCALLPSSYFAPLGQLNPFTGIAAALAWSCSVPSQPDAWLWAAVLQAEELSNLASVLGSRFRALWNTWLLLFPWNCGESFYSWCRKMSNFMKSKRGVLEGISSNAWVEI